jgi:hypothetical protein
VRGTAGDPAEPQSGQHEGEHMTTAKHTPGPWSVTRIGGVARYLSIVNANGGEIVTTDLHQTANASLIAAAPELYAALRAIVEQESQQQDAETRMHDMADLARAALAKVDA